MSSPPRHARCSPSSATPTPDLKQALLKQAQLSCRTTILFSPPTHTTSHIPSSRRVPLPSPFPSLPPHSQAPAPHPTQPPIHILLPIEPLTRTTSSLPPPRPSQKPHTTTAPSLQALTRDPDSEDSRDPPALQPAPELQHPRSGCPCSSIHTNRIRHAIACIPSAPSSPTTSPSNKSTDPLPPSTLPPLPHHPQHMLHTASVLPNTLTHHPAPLLQTSRTHTPPLTAA